MWFCTPGQIISAVAWMSGNICRCSAYPQIVAAVDQAAKRRNNADIPRDIDVFSIEEHDDHASKIGARGIGELGEVGVAAAIKNAIYHATGKRVRKLPVYIVGLIAHKPVNSGYRT
jgi:hypothetical protein